MGGIDSWSREGHAAYKRKLAEDPEERKRLSKSKRGEKPASKKVLMDRYNAARADLLLAIEREATHGKDSWWCGGKEWYAKRFDAARAACLKAGITGV